MKKRLWKKVLTAGCTATLLMTLTGTMVLADELSVEEGVFVGTVADDETLDAPFEDIGSVYGEVTQIAETDSSMEKSPTIEESVPYEADFPTEDSEESEESDLEMLREEEQIAEQTADDSSVEGSDAEILDDVATGIFEEAVEESAAQEVGAGTWTVGDGVTATFDSKTGELTFVSKGGTLWKNWKSKLGIDVKNIKSIKAANGSGFINLPVDSSDLFRECTGLTSIYFNKIDTSKVTSMSRMFCDCKSLAILDLSSFNTSHVTNMWMMFTSCSNLSKLDLSSFDTSNVTNMQWMFYGCRSLTNLDLSNFNTRNVMYMDYMFQNCSSLTNLDLSSFDTSSLNHMGWMFYGCSNLKNLDLSNFDTSGVTYMAWMFYGCSNLKNLDLSNFDTSNVTYMDGMFKDCSSLITLDLSSFNLASIAKDSDYKTNMFQYSSKLEILKTPNKNMADGIMLPVTMYDREGRNYAYLPKTAKSLLLASTKKKAAETFFDVIDPSLWYYDSVYWAVKNGVTFGMGEGTFQPMAKLSRAQAVTFLYNLAGKPDVSKLKTKEFTDVPKSAWFYNAVKWAVAKKITSGYGTGTFQPNTTCNRAMIVTFLANYSKAVGTYKAPKKASNFKDVPANAWYKTAVDWAVENGITSGYGQGTFSPNVTCNRAMMVTFLKRVAALPKK